MRENKIILLLLLLLGIEAVNATRDMINIKVKRRQMAAQRTYKSMQEMTLFGNMPL